MFRKLDEERIARLIAWPKFIVVVLTLTVFASCLFAATALIGQSLRMYAKVIQHWQGKSSRHITASK